MFQNKFTDRLTGRPITVLRRLTRVGWLALWLGLCGTGAANASPGTDALQFFFNEVDTFEASFNQEVLDESLQSIDSGQGTMMIKRPGLFRWDYAPPEAQKIVGDGDRVWIYDLELEQITVRNQKEALGRTPAILLAGASNIEQDYQVVDAGKQGSYDWINLIPLDQDSGFTEVRIGFEDNRLRLMELLDNLGQRTRISFVEVKENQPIADSAFEFEPPEGIDVIDQSGS